MRAARIAVAAVALGAVLPAFARARERVVFCRRVEGPCAVVGRKLGAVARGFWATVEDRVLRANPRNLPSVLYFSLEEYDSAVAGLTDEQRAQAVLHRLRRVAEGRVSFALGTVDEALVRAAQALPAGDSRALRALADAGALFQRSTFAGTDPQEALDLAGESLAELLVEKLGSAASAAYAREAAIYGRLTGRAPRSDTPRDTRPFTEAEPVYFIAPMSPRAIEEQRREGDVVLAWRDGMVAPFSARTVAQISGKARTVRILYPEKSDFFRDAVDLTPAQIDRRLQARLGGVTAHDRAQAFAELAFRHAVLCRALVRALEDAPSGARAGWQEALAVDLEALAAMFAEARRQGGEAPPGGLANLPEDLALAEALARQGGDAGTASDIARAAKIIARVRP
jgi:hypothetical protein